MSTGSRDVAARVHELESARALPLSAGLALQTTRFAADAVAGAALLGGGHALLHAAGVTAALRLDAAFTLVALVAGTVGALGGYRSLEGPCHVDSVTAVVKASAIALVALLAAAPILPAGSAPVVLAAADAVLLLVGLVALRVFAGPLEHRLRARSFAPVVIYGAGTTGRLLAQKLIHETALGLEPVGFVDDDPRLAGTSVRVGEGERGLQLPVLDRGAALGAVLERTRAAAVFIAIPSLPSERIAAIVDGLERRHLPVYFVPSSGDAPFASLTVTTVGGIPVLATRRPVRRAVYSACKRAFDVALALLLAVAAAPFILVAMLLVRLTSRGPVFFTHTRIGVEGEPFTIYKIRTMDAAAEAYAYHPESAKDARVTAVGRWLRRTSVDELPQLWNILRGDMSFVGPRPEMPFIVEGYNDTQLQRLMVKPGLTGLWQVSPDRAFRIHDNIHYDLYYVEHATLAMDLAILILTPFLLLSQRAAR